MSINFTARQVGSPTIQQRVSMFKYDNAQASIVELSRDDAADMKALKRASRDWYENAAKYAPQIYSRFNTQKNLDSVKGHVYALTTQQKDFHALEAGKIQGLMLFSELKDAENEILLLEVNPNTSRSMNFFRKYKQVGRRLVEHVQNNFNNKEMIVWADCSAIKFYKKLGFQQPFKKLPLACMLCWKG